MLNNPMRLMLIISSLMLSSLALPLQALEPTRNSNFSPAYMSVLHNSEIYAQVGEHVIPVGEIKRGQSLQMLAVSTDYYQFKFGHSTGFIDRDDVEPLAKNSSVADDLSEVQQLLANENFLTQKEVPIYSLADIRSEEVGILERNLRYPLIGKFKDRLSNTWYEINIGNRLGYINAREVEIDHGIPVITYHHLLKNEENKHFLNTSTTTSDIAFSNQMTYLKQTGYTTISLYELEEYLRNKINLPAKAVVLTFDDGLKSVYRYAYPVLKEYGFRATTFIISSRIKRHPQKWDPDELQFMSISELQESQDVFDVQSHTHFLHRTDDERHPILLSRSYHNILFDFERSRRALAQFNPHVLYLAYPFGSYNKFGVDAARNAGFHLAVTTIIGKVKPGDNPLTLKRIYILHNDSLQSVADKIANQPGTVVPH